VTDKGFYAVVALVVVAIFAGSFVLVEVARTPSKNPCVRNQPHEIVYGYIHHYGLFSKGTAYYLDYKGKWKLTGDECTKRCTVTEAEYDRQTYGRQVDDD